MAKGKPSGQSNPWRYFDDEQLAKLLGIIGSIQSARFSLELLCGNWQQMPDDTEQIVDQLRESHEALGEIFETLEELRDAE